MDAVYLIAYDLSRGGENQSAANRELAEKLKNLFPDHLHILESTWLICTKQTNCVRLSAIINSKFRFSVKDKIFITTIYKDSYNSEGFSPEENSWLLERVF